jgi:hypothetical protein
MNKDITGKIQRIKNSIKSVCDCLGRDDPIQAMALTVEMGGHCRRLANDFQKVIWDRTGGKPESSQAQITPADQHS